MCTVILLIFAIPAILYYWMLPGVVSRKKNMAGYAQPYANSLNP